MPCPDDGYRRPTTLKMWNYDASAVGLANYRRLPLGVGENYLPSLVESSWLLEDCAATC